jgi:hypothetical protein
MPQEGNPENTNPILYDAKGRIIRTDHSDPETKRKDKPAKRRTEQRTPSQQTRRRIWPWWLRGKALFLELCTVVGLLLAIYKFHPVLSPSSATPSERHDIYGARVMVTHSGWNIRDVSVQCFTNKVLFKDKYTLAFEHFVLLNEYSVSGVKSGEPFPADCAFAWTLWTRPEDGFFIYGGGTEHCKWGYQLCFEKTDCPCLDLVLRSPQL